MYFSGSEQCNGNTQEAQTGANLLHEGWCISLRPQQSKTLQLYLDAEAETETDPGPVH